MLTKPIVGAEQAVQILAAAARVADPIEYTLEVNDGGQTILLWRGNADGFHLEAATILLENTEGLIREIRVLMRPWPVVKHFRDAMYDRLAATIPPDFWELQPKPAPTGQPRRFTAIGLRDLKSAPDVVLHSPMLAKSVTSKDRLKSRYASRTRCKARRPTPRSLPRQSSCSSSSTATPTATRWKECGCDDSTIKDASQNSR